MTTDARKAYDKRRLEAGAMLDAINQHLAAESQRLGPDLTDWSHVGNLGHVNERLDEICRFLRIETHAETTS